MTRNTITRARIILAYEQRREFKPYDKPGEKLAKNGIEYRIYDNRGSYYKVNAVDPTQGNWVWDDTCTHFSTFDEAAEVYYKQKDTIRGQADFNGDKKAITISIVGYFKIYEDTVTGRIAYDPETAAGWSKNQVVICIDKQDLQMISETDKRHLVPVKRTWMTSRVDFEEDGLFYEFYDVVYDDNHVPHFQYCLDYLPLLIKRDRTLWQMRYNESKHIFIKHQQIYPNNEKLKYQYCYGESNNYRGYIKAIDISDGTCELPHYSSDGELAQISKQIAFDWGCPQYFFDSYSYNPQELDHLSDVIEVSVDPLHPYSDSETQICKDVADFLKDVPFDLDHKVVKFRNGYILRFGMIVQAWKVTEPCYRSGTICRIQAKKSENTNAENELVAEQFVEYARLFINNTFSTRSLSLATEGGRKWRHDGIHLVGSLFVNNPIETKLSIDVEDFNRKALIELYTVHPKLKYMKKYMEKHPSVLYDSCVPFLRALFMYNMILETLIALGKDGIFWTPVEGKTYRRHYYGYHGTGEKSAKVTEEFSMESFIENFGLRDVPQKGDFYQRLGLTKQQFKLLFDPNTLGEALSPNKAMYIITDITFPLPGEHKEIKCRGWCSERKLLRLVSFEDFRIALAIIRALYETGISDYSIAGDINSLRHDLGSFKRVYKALVERKYDTTLYKDYIRMRKELKDNQYPEYKESIWDIFPDDNTDLQRYHDRIMFLSIEMNTYRAVSGILYRGYDYLTAEGLNSNPNTLQVYQYCKEHNLEAAKLRQLLEITENIDSMSGRVYTKRDLFWTLPTSQLQLEEMYEKADKIRNTIANLYSVYWGDDRYTSYHYNADKIKEQWGGIDFRTFVLSRVNTGLDANKYDLYIRLRNKFINNMNNFNVQDYPFNINDGETLERLYNQLAANEEELNEAIRRREAARRRQEREAAEAKVVEQQKKYVERYKKLKSLNFKGLNYQIVVPKNLCELIIEGQTLHHCVGSFVDSVSEGKDTVVFLRKVEDLETPYVTIALLPTSDGKQWYIDQAHTDRNGPITEEDRNFLLDWARENNIIESSVKINYGAHCHQ